MADTNTPFLPDWVSPPGETISDIAEERGWSQGELAQGGRIDPHAGHGNGAHVVRAQEGLARVEGVTAAHPVASATPRSISDNSFVARFP